MSAPAFVAKQKVYAVLHGTFHPATIVEVSEESDGTLRYYVHYAEQDNRLDRWLHAGDIKDRGARQPHSHSHEPTTPVGGVTTRRQSVAASAAADKAVLSKYAKNAKGGGQYAHSVKVSAKRARKDSSFFSRPKNIRSICIGPYEVETWYFSPYHMARPEVRCALEAAAQFVPGDMELQLSTTTTTAAAAERGSASASASAAPTVAAGPATACTLHLCPCCLQPFLDGDGVARHLRLACARHPPGAEIYRDPVRQLTVLEVDGRTEPVFCEHLALLSKLFLEHKALDHDMTPFLFYVLCFMQPYGLEVLGYFSKEKVTPELYNLSCILVLPQFQSRGIGRFLIELSYEVSRREGKLGTPEKPLSDLGEKLYLRYWGDCVTTALASALEEGHTVTLDYIEQATGIVQADILRTLYHLQLLNDNRQICISEEIIQKSIRKRLCRESEIQNYTFYPHLLSWCPGMYQEIRGATPAPVFVVNKSGAPAAPATADPTTTTE